MSKILTDSFESAEEKIIQELKKEGFGIVTELDLQEKFRDKLNIDFRKYKILGACNPEYAYKALNIEDKVGVMLPCNVVIQELKSGKIEVAIVNPIASMSGIVNSKLIEFAGEIQQKLKLIIDHLS
ncbi:MAG: DUF302 domain-containing protein [Paludibacter sp.]|nr:DUF302 domain-containing protein [Paludibacter sp.]